MSSSAPQWLGKRRGYEQRDQLETPGLGKDTDDLCMARRGHRLFQTGSNNLQECNAGGHHLTQGPGFLRAGVLDPPSAATFNTAPRALVTPPPQP